MTMISAKQMRESLGVYQAWKAIFRGGYRMVSLGDGRDEASVIFEPVPGKDITEVERSHLVIKNFPHSREFLEALEGVASKLADLGITMNWHNASDEEIEMEISSFGAPFVQAMEEVEGMYSLQVKVAMAFSEADIHLKAVKSAAIEVTEGEEEILEPVIMRRFSLRSATDWGNEKMGPIMLERMMGPNPIDFNNMRVVITLNW
jgi:hypothetical protein